MSYSFCPISSPGAVRNVIIDYTDALGLNEYLRQDGVSISSPYSGVDITGETVNITDVFVDGHTVPTGKGIQFTITTTEQAEVVAKIHTSFVGEQGTADSVCIDLPIRTCL